MSPQCQFTLNIIDYKAHLPHNSNNYFFLCFLFRDLPCTMTLMEMKSLFRMNDIIASAPQSITTLEVSARSGQGLKEVLSWLESLTGT